ncbi:MULTISPECIES: hypothetical protein [Inquilinus]|jgi:hypothetical protein|uniref:DUF1918 domain-containing protein n=1 Tax=Inquilinus ginsengisoli TaxID=363840 RepID=A0ABU1JSS4_9PROT|nr:hypothetical protein [Inquilinus ginsengisoli]MDR6291676.1 hypothetical protein [Inquilinus ginsengisoli]
MSNRYEIGTTVYVWRRSVSGPSVAGAFTVVAHYPSETSGRLYRIRSATGNEERMAPEHELSVVPRPPAAVTARTSGKRQSA